MRRANIVVMSAITNRVGELPADVIDSFEVDLSRQLPKSVEGEIYKRDKRIQLAPELESRVSWVLVSIIGTPVVHASVLIRMAPDETVFDQSQYPDNQ